MEQKWLWPGVILAAIITASVSIKHPYILSSIPVGDGGTVIQLVGKIYPVAVSVVLAGLLLAKNEGRQMALLRSAIANVVLLYLTLIIYFSISLYQLWQNHVLGQYFLPPHSYYYVRMVWRFARPYFLSSLAAVVLMGLFLFLNFLRRGRLLGEIEVLTGGFIGLVLGFERSIIALILALCLSIGVSFTMRIRGSKRLVRLTAPLLVSGWIAMLWGGKIAQLLFGA